MRPKMYNADSDILNFSGPRRKEKSVGTTTKKRGSLIWVELFPSRGESGWTLYCTWLCIAPFRCLNKILRRRNERNVQSLLFWTSLNTKNQFQNILQFLVTLPYKVRYLTLLPTQTQRSAVVTSSILQYGVGPWRSRYKKSLLYCPQTPSNR